MLRYLNYLWRVPLLILPNLYAFLCYMLWMLLLWPLRYLAPRIYWKIESFMFRMIQNMVVTWVDLGGGYKVLECGDDVSLLHDSEAIILCNHQSTADTPLVMLTSYNKGKAAGSTMWIMYILFKYTNFGLISCLRQDFFIDQGKNVRHTELTRLKDHLLQSYLPLQRKWIIVFPEGGFLYKRLEASQNYAKKNGFPVLEHVTLPRIGAMQTILNTVGEPYQEAEASQDVQDYQTSDSWQDDLQIKDSARPLKWVVDVTIAYKDGKPLDMLGICMGFCPRDDILVHYRAYRAKDIPRDDEGLTKWLYERYTEKEALLKHYYQTGQLTEEVLNTRHILPHMKMSYLRFDVIEQLLVHMFCLVSCYTHYVFIGKPIVAAVFSLISSLF